MKRLLTIAALLCAAAVYGAEHSGAPYAGMEKREIKALSASERAALLEGQGMGLALAAELNGYPGPVHVGGPQRLLQLNSVASLSALSIV